MIVSVLVGLGLFVLGLILELRGRRLQGLLPDSFAALRRYGTRSLAPNPNFPIAIFAFGSWFLFAAWESFLRVLWDRLSSPALSFLGFLLGVGFLLHRWKSLANSKQTLRFYEVVWVCASLTLLWSSWWSTVLLVWVFFRVRFLRVEQPVKLL
jgi:hypothetical protein